MNPISWKDNVVSLQGNLLPEHIFQFSKALHMIHTVRGYDDIILDFSETVSIFETFMVPSISQCRKYMGDKVDFSIWLPKVEKLRSLFHNSNWSHLISPHTEEPTTFVGVQHLPAQAYRSSDEQLSVVNMIMDVVIGSLRLDRSQLKALEWCVNEITDNVLNHAQSQFGGVVQATTYASTNSVEFVVADAGIGIRKSLQERDDVRALGRAIQEGVTRDARTNQGNGLYGSFRVATISGGRFQLHSGHGSLVAIGSDKVKTFKQPTSIFPGTAVISQIVCRDEQLIAEALKFRGRIHDPAHDYIEQKYEDLNVAEFHFLVHKETAGFGSRDTGRVIRNKIMNLLRSDGSYILNIDFSNVSLISSSFADEAIAKVFLELGPINFMKRVKITSADSTIQALIDRAILQRSSQMTLDDNGA
jgi:hypothetical protein